MWRAIWVCCALTCITAAFSFSFSLPLTLSLSLLSLSLDLSRCLFLPLSSSYLHLLPPHPLSLLLLTMALFRLYQGINLPAAMLVNYVR